MYADAQKKRWGDLSYKTLKKIVYSRLALMIT